MCEGMQKAEYWNKNTTAPAQDQVVSGREKMRVWMCVVDLALFHSLRYKNPTRLFP